MQKKKKQGGSCIKQKGEQKKIINNDGIFKEMADAVSDKRALAQPNIQKKNKMKKWTKNLLTESAARTRRPILSTRWFWAAMLGM